jgi:hypothetical protein
MAKATADHRCVKTEDHAVTAGHSVDPARWQEVFEGLMDRITGRFSRVEPRRRVRQLVLGLLSDLPRKNCWTMAEWAGDTTPDGMQHLLGRAKWDADAVRNDVRGYVVEYLSWIGRRVDPEDDVLDDAGVGFFVPDQDRAFVQINHARGHKSACFEGRADDRARGRVAHYVGRGRHRCLVIHVRRCARQSPLRAFTGHPG